MIIYRSLMNTIIKNREDRLWKLIFNLSILINHICIDWWTSVILPMLYIELRVRYTHTEINTKFSHTDARQNNQALILGGKTLSIMSMSFPKRFNILPDGVVSKNPRGDRSIPNNNSECRSLLLCRHPTTNAVCDSTTKVAEI